MHTQRFGIYAIAIAVLSALLLLGLIIPSVANAENICDPPIEEININDIKQYSKSIIDYMSGMTDQYIVRIYNEIVSF